MKQVLSFALRVARSEATTCSARRERNRQDLMAQFCTIEQPAHRAVRGGELFGDSEALLEVDYSDATGVARTRARKRKAC